MSGHANPKCKICKGTGWKWIMVGDEPERDLCDCVEFNEDTFPIVEEEDLDEDELERTPPAEFGRRS